MWALGMTSALCLPPPLAGSLPEADAQELSLPKGWKPYKSPDLAYHFDMQALSSHPVCSIELFRELTPRLERLFTDTCSLKVWINKGVPGKNTLGAVFESGWIERRQQRQPNGPEPVRFHSGKEEVSRSANGSGSLVRIKCKDGDCDAILSNNHVICAARPEIAAQAISNYTFDINLLDARHFQNTLADRFDVPIGQMVDANISNDNLTSKRVQIFGIGWNLYNIVGTPIRLSFRDRSGPEPGRARECFALIAEREILGGADVIGGMSGSPVVLEGTRDVVGVLSRVYTVNLGKRQVVLLVFSGPNEIRGLLDTFRAAKGKP